VPGIRQHRRSVGHRGGLVWPSSAGERFETFTMSL
jgi:hypothetical protein